jgi:creatinine amidohydrolase
VRVASMMWARLAADVCAEAVVSDAYGHACETETSLALALAPDLVRTDKIAAPAARPAQEPHAAPPRALVNVATAFEELAPDGVYGDPRHASRELGERILDVALERALEFCRAFASAGTTPATSLRNDGSHTTGLEPEISEAGVAP